MNTQDPTFWQQALDWVRDPMIGGALLGTLVLVTLGCCTIFVRAGFHWALGILMLVPVVNVVPFLLLAFGAWPAHRELRSLRKLQGRVSRAEERYTRAA